VLFTVSFIKRNDQICTVICDNYSLAGIVLVFYIDKRRVSSGVTGVNLYRIAYIHTIPYHIRLIM